MPWWILLLWACGDKDGAPVGGEDSGGDSICREPYQQPDGTWWGRVGAFYPDGHPEYADIDISDSISVFSADYQQTLCTGRSYGKIVDVLSCDGCIEAARFEFGPFDTLSGDCEAYGLPFGHVEPSIAYGRASSLAWEGEVLEDVLLGFDEGLGVWCPIGSWSEYEGEWQGEPYDSFPYQTWPGQPAW
ncbi:hypothetical protein L6R53_00290 [Myxococcota bacterium]|nr:hypothetical protein [Myxococcota bacterium]